MFARIVTYTADPSPGLQSATVANIEQGLRRTRPSGCPGV